MNQHDIDRIANALWILLQYKDNEKFNAILQDSSSRLGLQPDRLIESLEDLQTYF